MDDTVPSAYKYHELRTACAKFPLYIAFWLTRNFCIVLALGVRRHTLTRGEFPVNSGAPRFNALAYNFIMWKHSNIM